MTCDNLRFFSCIIGSTVLVNALYDFDVMPSLVFTARATDLDTGLLLEQDIRLEVHPQGGAPGLRMDIREPYQCEQSKINRLYTLILLYYNTIDNILKGVQPRSVNGYKGAVPVRTSLDQSCLYWGYKRKKTLKLQNDDNYNKGAIASYGCIEGSRIGASKVRLTGYIL